MKTKITNKELTTLFDNILVIDNATRIPYIDAKFYNYGIYGWNYDVYVMNYNTCIIKSYRNTPKKAIRVSSDDKAMKKYNKNIEKLTNSNINYDVRIQKNIELLEKLIKGVL